MVPYRLRSAVVRRRTAADSCWLLWYGGGEYRGVHEQVGFGFYTLANAYSAAGGCAVNAASVRPSLPVLIRHWPW